MFYKNSENPGRNMDIFLERVLEENTFSGIGKKHGISGQTVKIIVTQGIREMKRQMALLDSAKRILSEARSLNQKTQRIFDVIACDVGEQSKVYLVSDMDLSHRTLHCLRNEGITYISQLENLSEGDLLRWPNFGRKSLNELKEQMALLGFTLALKRWSPG